MQQNRVLFGIGKTDNCIIRYDHCALWIFCCITSLNCQSQVPVVSQFNTVYALTMRPFHYHNYINYWICSGHYKVDKSQISLQLSVKLFLYTMIYFSWYSILPENHTYRNTDIVYARMYFFVHMKICFYRFFWLRRPLKRLNSVTRG